MNNAEYLKQKKISPETATYREVLEVLESYGDNHWWLSDDPRVRAYYQTLDESSYFLLPYRQYLSDLSILLQRDVQLYETRMSNKAELKPQAIQAWGQGTVLEDTSVHTH